MSPIRFCDRCETRRASTIRHQVEGPFAYCTPCAEVIDQRTAIRLGISVNDAALHTKEAS